MQYLECKSITQSEFLRKTDIKRGFLDGDKLKGAVSDLFLTKIIAAYPDVSLMWLLTGEGEMLKNTYLDTHLNTHLDNKKEEKTAVYKQQAGLFIAAEPTAIYGNKNTERLNDTNVIEIPIVDISAAASYGFMNPDYIEHTGAIKLPTSMIKGGGLRYCIRVKSHSMTPTLQDGDLVVVRHLERGEWQNMRDEHIYLIVDKDGMAVIKRVKNRFNKGFIVLMSDNIDKVNYRNYNLQADEVHNIFHAEWYFSAKMDNINNLYYNRYNRLKTLEDRLDEVEHKIERGIK